MGKPKHVSHIRLKFFHADDLVNAMMDNPIENIKRIWYENYERQLTLAADKSLWSQPKVALALVQSRHYLMATTTILKHWFEWDDAQCHPKDRGF